MVIIIIILAYLRRGRLPVTMNWGGAEDSAYLDQSSEVKYRWSHGFLGEELNLPQTRINHSHLVSLHQVAFWVKLLSSNTKEKASP